MRHKISWTTDWVSNVLLQGVLLKSRTEQNNTVAPTLHYYNLLQSENQFRNLFKNIISKLADYWVKKHMKILFKISFQIFKVLFSRICAEFCQINFRDAVLEKLNFMTHKNKLLGIFTLILTWCSFRSWGDWKLHSL